LPLIEGLSEGPHALNILLVKWQAGGEYLEKALSLLAKPEYCQTIMQPMQCGTNIFGLIYSRVPREERYSLIKAVLEADMSIQHAYDELGPDFPEWLKQWRQICKYCNRADWKSAFRELSQPILLPPRAGDDFKLAVIALVFDRHLEYRKNLLKCYGISSSTHWREQYLQVLNHAKGSELDAHPSLYKHLLEVISWNESISKTKLLLKQNQDIGVENDDKYKQLIVLNTGTERNQIDGMLNGLIENVNSRFNLSPC